jgi:hypothetical protein
MLILDFLLLLYLQKIFHSQLVLLSCKVSPHLLFLSLELCLFIYTFRDRIHQAVNPTLFVLRSKCSVHLILLHINRFLLFCFFDFNYMMYNLCCLALIHVSKTVLVLVHLWNRQVRIFLVHLLLLLL